MKILGSSDLDFSIQHKPHQNEENASEIDYGLFREKDYEHIGLISYIKIGPACHQIKVEKSQNKHKPSRKQNSSEL